MSEEEFYALSETPGEPRDLQAGLLADFDKATCPAEKLAEIQIPPRAPIVGNWLMEGDLGFVFGARGFITLRRAYAETKSDRVAIQILKKHPGCNQ